MIRKGLLLFSTLILLIAVAACGGNGVPGPSPTGPSATPPATNGATIDGVVSGLAGTSAAGLVGARDVMTVTATVGDVTITATIDGQGKFTITGLPAGTVTLTFSGTTATCTLEQVRAMERIRLVLTIEGATIRVETQERAAEDGKVELEGRISAKAAQSFTVGTTQVLLTSGVTVLQQGETTTTIGDLAAALMLVKVGDRVHVRGVSASPTAEAVGATAAISADLVILQNTNPKVPVNLKGTVGTITGTCPAVTFPLQGWTVVASGATDFRKGECAQMTAGTTVVHVKGTVDDTGKVQATWIQFDK